MQTQQLKLSLFQTHLQIFHRMDRLLIVLKQMLFGAGQTLLDQLPTFSSKTMKELKDLYEFRVNSLSLYIDIYYIECLKYLFTGNVPV